MPDAARRNPDWEWDETVLACDLVFQNDWQPLPPEDERVIELSRILRHMSLHPLEKRLSSFRNEDGVSRKTHNLASAAPDWGKRRSNGSERDQEVDSDQFQVAPDVMHRIAQDLLQDALNDRPEMLLKFEGNDDGSVLEGRYLWRFHSRNASATCAAPKKGSCSVMRAATRLSVKRAVSTSGRSTGTEGQGYIECHHVQPLHETGHCETRSATSPCFAATATG